MFKIVLIKCYLIFVQVFICTQGTEGDISETFQSSDLYEFLDEVKNVITLHLSLPDNRKGNSIYITPENSWKKIDI